MVNLLIITKDPIEIVENKTANEAMINGACSDSTLVMIEKFRNGKSNSARFE